MAAVQALVVLVADMLRFKSSLRKFGVAVAGLAAGFVIPYLLWPALLAGDLSALAHVLKFIIELDPHGAVDPKYWRLLL